MQNFTMCYCEENSVSVEKTLSVRQEKREVRSVRDHHFSHKLKNVGLSERSIFLDVYIRGERQSSPRITNGVPFIAGRGGIVSAPQLEDSSLPAALVSSSTEFPSLTSTE